MGPAFSGIFWPLAGLAASFQELPSWTIYFRFQRAFDVINAYIMKGRYILSSCFVEKPVKYFTVDIGLSNTVLSDLQCGNFYVEIEIMIPIFESKNNFTIRNENLGSMPFAISDFAVQNVIISMWKLKS